MSFLFQVPLVIDIIPCYCLSHLLGLIHFSKVNLETSLRSILGHRLDCFWHSFCPFISQAVHRAAAPKPVPLPPLLKSRQEHLMEPAFLPHTHPTPTSLPDLHPSSAGSLCVFILLSESLAAGSSFFRIRIFCLLSSPVLRAGYLTCGAGKK